MSTIAHPKQSRCAVIIQGDDEVHIPEWVVNLKTFRRWIQKEELPERGRIDYLKGRIWVDMSMEQIISHNQVKAEFYGVLVPLVKQGRLGRFFPDGARVTSLSGDWSAEPDGTFASRKSLRSRRITLVPGAKEGHVELQGTPDMVLEIISPGSVHKDTEVLFKAYQEAGIPEYWLVDARRTPLRFEIFQYAETAYTSVSAQRGGWLKSAVFGKSFRLTRHSGDDNYAEFTLSFR